MSIFYQAHINRSLGALLKELKLDQLPLEDQEKSLQLLMGRFEEVVMNTFLRELTPEQASELKKFDHDPAALESAAANLAADIPDMDKKIEDALQHELELLKYGMNA
jgi:hypothetical protein